MLQSYDATIKDQLNKGIVEEVDDMDQPVPGATHYIPHHAVIRQDKSTTKLRIVYDASAKQDGPSLNDCLHAGPKFGQNIMDIILRFRVHKVALTADIEKAFLMVSVAEKDRNVLRFLWIDDVLKDDPKIIPLRFRRVVFGVSSSPFLLNATIRHHLKKHVSTMPDTVARVSRSIYVDDVVYGADSEDQAYQLYLETKSLLQSGGFNLRKFVTNSTPLQRKIDQQEAQLHANLQPSDADQDQDSYTKSTLGTSSRVDDGEHRILGIRWDYTTDCLLFDMKDLALHASKLDPTKRGIVGVASRVYDPVGFVSPVTIRFKVLFQELCEAKIGWDEPLPHHLLTKWLNLVSSLQQNVLLAIPRRYSENVSLKSARCRLVGFCDASKRAYAAVVYLVIASDHGCTTRFVACKTRVSPVKEQTIPRLELLSALLLSRLMTSVSQALSLELSLGEPSYFTDSKVSLYWIKGQDREWKPFVQNRVNQIRNITQPHKWAHCAGKENPADIPSRGIEPCGLVHNSLWLYGPSWLHSGTPDVEDPVQMPQECKAEQRKLKKTVAMLVADEIVNIGSLINCKDFSSRERLVRVTAYVLRFVRALQRKSAYSSRCLTPEELHRAELYWLKEAQSLMRTKPVFKIWQQQFGLFCDEFGVWRCGGRLHNANLPFETKHPVFLDSHHHFATLIVRDAHARVQHDGVSETLTELRDRYWIVRGRSFVRGVLHKCVTCRRFEGRPHYPPASPPLPAFRVKEAPAFTHTGVDYAGPLFIKSDNASRESKVWICLYTCCIVRAIHLEVVPDLTAQSFIRCFKRFSARRGFPTRMVSDNGTTFKAASKMLRNIVKHPGVERSLSRIQWVFNMERAPWWGGIFERMVRSVKRCMRKTIGRGRLTLDELQTATAEVEMIVNSRPLSYISTDSIQEPITPSHLMTGRRLMSLPDGPYNTELSADVSLATSDISRRMYHLNTVLEHFWKQWKREYLLELRESHRHANRPPKKSHCSPIAVGDMVLVHEDSKPRGFWKIAKVESLTTGTDGLTRGAVVKVASSAGRPTMLRRPLQLLYPLEVQQCDGGVMPDTADAHKESDTANNDTADAFTGSEPRRCSNRVASRNAREFIRLQSEDTNDL